MAQITIPGMFLTGDHASRPAANAVGGGALYSCTDHDLIYQSDGAAWSTWATVGGPSGGGGITWAANLYRDIGTTDYPPSTTASKFSGASNRMSAMAFMPRKTLTPSNVYGRIGTQSGNLDIGVYDASLTKLFSTGSFACPAGGNFSRALVSASSLTAGTLYYLAWLADNTTATAFATQGQSAATGQSLYWYFDVGSFPLPTGPVTPTGYDPSGAVIGLWLA